MKPTIAVLLSTYNGERYLREQLDSVLAQDGVDITLLARDDGSKDGTVSILQGYAAHHANVILLQEENAGAEESFNRLCAYANENIQADYYAFCDQDDVWDADKLSVATKALARYEKEKPSLYFSNLRMVDSELNYIRNLFQPDEVKATKDMALLQIFTYGCTCVFNRRALECYCSVERNQTFHDNWVYVLCAYLGHVCYDPIPHISYRQHGTNLSGAKLSGLSLFLHRLSKITHIKGEHDFEFMARQLLTFEAQLPDSDSKIVRRVATYRYDLSSRLWLLFSPRYKTGHWFKDLCICYRILSNAQ